MKRILFLGTFCWMLVLSVLTTIVPSALATTRCVGKSPCLYTTIGAAVAASAPNDTITVEPGTYKEDVVIGKPLSLIGQERENTIIDAEGLSNGIYIDGFDNAGLAHVVVTGFTVENANFEGILVQNASFVTIWGNHVRDNDKSLVPASPSGTCTDQTTLAPFETNEGDDCGEGIHLIGVDHSTVANNLVEHNAGGILVSDETAPNHDNAITRNSVKDNAYDCGITVASHKAYVKSGTPPLAFGIFHNTISENDSIHNGFGFAGAGAGVGLFAPGPGNQTVGNSVVHNRLIDNALPGVVIHNHVFLTFPGHPPNPNVDDNVIVGNFISGNGADSDVPTTVPTGISILGTTPITGLVISDNVISDENIDVAVNSASTLDLHLNDLLDGTVGIDNVNASGAVNATENWWGCPDGPGAKGCSTITSVSGGTVLYTPWLTQPVDESLERDQDRGHE
jgi:nitrous oxidase accessory protein NosD